MTQELTQEYLKSILDYNPDTGVFTWKVNGNNQYVKIGNKAGCFDKSEGYIKIEINRKKYKSHRLVYFYIHGEFPDGQIDHINHDRLDNRISNLRVVSNQENCKNQSKPKNNTSGIIGVTWSKRENRWRAQIIVNYKNIHLGYFHTIEEAASARKLAEIYYGFHKNHGVDNAV